MAGRRDAKTCGDTCRLSLHRGEERVRSQLVLSLFPGADLLGRAFEAVGFTVVRGPDVLWGGDVHSFHVPAGKFDGVIGGPPCQTFSRASGISGTKAVNLIPEYLRLVQEAHPKWAVMENVEGAIPAGPDWPYTILEDFDCGGATGRKRPFWFYGIAPVAEPPHRKGEREYTVLATSWNQKDADGYVFGGHSKLDASEAARLQGYPGLGERIAFAQPSNGGKAGLGGNARRILAVHMLGNGVPRAMGEYVARHVKRQVQKRDEWGRTDMPPYPLFMAAGK